MPVFKGCESEVSLDKKQCTVMKIITHVFENFEYPEKARKLGITGRVYIKFVVNSKGKVVNVEVLKGVHKILDDACIKAVQSLPDMIPGYQLGKNVSVSYTIPINIQAEKSKKEKKKGKKKK